VKLGEILVGMGAVITALAGFATAYSSIVKAKQEGSADCEQRLKVAREESEAEAVELHRWRLAHPEGLPQ